MRKQTEFLGGENYFRKGWSIYVNRSEEAFDLKRHNHDFIEISYVMEGEGFHHFGDNRVETVMRGDITVLPPGVSHVFRPLSAQKDRRLVIINCVFKEELLMHLAREEAPGLNLEGMFHVSAGEAGCWLRDRRFDLEALFQGMLEEYNADRPGAFVLLHALLLQLLVRLYRARTFPAYANAGSGDPLAEVFHFIRMSPAGDLTLARAAELARMSERHFFRVFKQRTGQTYYEYIQHGRVRLACELLETTPAKISAVAASVGYRDVESFTRVFKKITGMTPGSYRRQNADIGRQTQPAVNNSQKRSNDPSADHDL